MELHNVNILATEGVGMARTRRPPPIDLTKALVGTLRDIGVLDELDIVRTVAKHRLYDRTSGNFKGMGWECTVLVGRRVKMPDGTIGTLGSRNVNIAILDSQIAEYRQATLL